MKIILLLIVVGVAVLLWRAHKSGLDPWLLLVRWWGRVKATLAAIRAKLW